MDNTNENETIYYDCTKDLPAFSDVPADDENTPQEKFTAFSMYEHFREHTRHAKIGGIFHIYHETEKCYRPIDKQGLESYLLDQYYDKIAQSGSLRIIKTCAELILRKAALEVSSADENMQLCFKSGYVPLSDINTAVFTPYRENDPPSSFVFSTYTINATPAPCIGSWNIMKALPTPKMDDYIYEITGGNQEITARIWQMIGYLLTPDMRGKCFFLLQGVPNSGKSVLGTFLSHLFSDYRVASLDIDQLGKRHATSALMNKSVNISMDLPNKILSPLAIRNIKLMTGNDDITIEHRNGKLEKYRGTCKFLFATNHPLTLSGFDKGFENRIVRIPFPNEITIEQMNFDLWSDLLREKDNIVTKAIAYYRDLRLHNYEFPGSELEICKPNIRYLPTEAEDQDASLCWFIETRCEIVDPNCGGIYTEVLYKEYLSYCKDMNETPIDNIPSFSRRLLRCYGGQIIKKRWRSPGSDINRWGFRGIAILPMQFFERNIQENGI